GGGGRWRARVGSCTIIHTALDSNVKIAACISFFSYSYRMQDTHTQLGWPAVTVLFSLLFSTLLTEQHHETIDSSGDSHVSPQVSAPSPSPHATLQAPYHSRQEPVLPSVLIFPPPSTPLWSHLSAVSPKTRRCEAAHTCARTAPAVFRGIPAADLMRPQGPQGRSTCRTVCFECTGGRPLR
ncbi:hypothetical protein FN846DRAFT_413062, partial [Sphaerosporella brunnea]